MLAVKVIGELKIIELLNELEQLLEEILSKKVFFPFYADQVKNALQKLEISKDNSPKN